MNIKKFSELTENITTRSYRAFEEYRKVSHTTKSRLLQSIAQNLEELGDELITALMQETNLPQSRLINERTRTTSQLRMFAEVLEEGLWVEATIVTAQPERLPQARPDIRKMLQPLGPAVIFAASNFPLAFSTAGGDTASALAAGCPVILKAHPSHLQSSRLAAKCIQQALQKNQISEDVFIHYEAENDEALSLVQHPIVQIVTFTGSFHTGKIVFQALQHRTQPIPFFAEMGSLNPVIVLPEKLQQDVETIVQLLSGAVVQGCGQFCTKPGLIVGLKSEKFEECITLLRANVESTQVGRMLNQGIHHSYVERISTIASATTIASKKNIQQKPALQEVQPLIVDITAQEFLDNPVFHDEVFGPFALVIVCSNTKDLNDVLHKLDGQLTITVMATENDLRNHQNLFEIATQKAGRIIINGVPTGVEVCSAMHHGGAYPATTDSRFTSVGTDAIKRFVRPVCYQNVPDEFLPPELQRANPLGIWRRTNNEWHKS